MSAETIEELRQQFTGRRVLVDAQRPELARMAGKVGRVKAINGNGRALVQFEHHDPGWYDIDPEYLKLADRPEIP